MYFIGFSLWRASCDFLLLVPDGGHPVLQPLDVLQDFVRRRRLGVPAARRIVGVHDIATLLETGMKDIAIGLRESRDFLQLFRVDVIAVPLDDTEQRDILQRALP